MKRRRHFLATLLLGMVPCLSAQAKTRRYRLTLVFSEPDFKWTRTIDYRENFHLFLDASPFPTVKDIIYVVGTVYPKKGEDHVTIAIGTTVDKNDAGELLGEVRYLKLPKSGEFDIPPVGKHFKACKAKVEFVR